MAEAMGRMTAAFNESDSNGDGRLDRAESDVFYTKLAENARARGEFGSTYPEGLADNYRLGNCISAEEGYTYQEFMMSWGPVMKVWEELKAAKEAAAQ